MTSKFNINPEKLVYSEQENIKCKEELTNHIKQISKKLNSNTECKEDLKFLKNKLTKQIDEHLNSECNRILTAKKLEIKKELDICLENFENKIINSNIEGENIKMRLEEEIKNYQEIVNSIKTNNNIGNKTPEPDYDEFDGDALMINESINEFSENLNTDKRVTALQNEFKKIEDLLKQMNSFLNEDLNNKSLELTKIGLNLDTLNLIHLKSNHSEYGLVDQTMFKLETRLTDNFSFEKDNECLIKFNCPFLRECNNNIIKMVDYIRVELLDPSNNSVKVNLKETISSDASKRHFFLRFTPNNAGIYKITIKYKNLNILDSPLCFVVLPIGNPNLDNQNFTEKTSSISTESFDFNVTDTNSRLRSLQLQQQQQQQQQQNQHEETRHSRASLPAFPDIKQNDTFEKNFSNTVSVGRGRFLRQKDSLKSSSIQICSSLSQKRKSPSYQSEYNNNNNNNNNSDHNNNEQNFEFDLDNDLIMPESANKRAELMDTINQTKSSFVSDSSLNVTTTDSANTNQVSLCILSDHVRKHSSQNNNSLLSLSIPPLKAKFVQKFSNCSFPIGVRTCSKRDWLIVCDCGNDLIKIFDKNTAELLRTIQKSNDSDDKKRFTFKRPSALLIDYENDDLIFVKDDKEILVFDMSKDCQFMYKFGIGILQRPYGLTFNKIGHLIVIDANTRNPLIHTFNKYTGELVKSCPYQPVLQQYAKSEALNSNFYDNKAVLLPFESTKIRFIDCAKDFIFASDLGRSIIFKTTLDGEIALAFGQFGKSGSMGQFNEPSGIHVDYDGKTVLVGDSKNNKLQLYDDQGNYKCNIEFIDEKIVRPSDIHIDSHGYLYVTCFIQHCIKKFKLI